MIHGTFAQRPIEHGDAAEAEGERGADADQDLQAEERRETEADANGQRRRRTPRRGVDGRRDCRATRRSALSIASTIPCCRERPETGRNIGGLTGGAASVIFLALMLEK